MRRFLGGLALGLVVPLLGCTVDGEPDAGSTTRSTTGSTPDPSATSPALTPSAPPPPTPAPTAPLSPDETLPPVTNRLSLPALMRQDWRASRIRQVAVEAETDAYTRSRVTYRSGDLTISGVLLRPRGRGPFPGIVLNHGYIKPAFYTTGQGLAREQDWLARQGFVVLHTDYRGHWTSDPPVGPFDRESRLGYTRDAINAVLALEREPYVDPDRMAMLGRSMGGGVTLNALVVYPDLVEAAVVYASVSSKFVENLEHFTEPNRPEALQRLYARFGTPQDNPRFYRDLSSRTFFDRISDPLLIHHGTADETCPFRWARTTQRLLERAGADSRLEVYDGEMHSFVPRWQASIERTVQFLRRRLG
jgi:dipeptidyl aminopeptidase/acylaminoacyl peptidase